MLTWSAWLSVAKCENTQQASKSESINCTVFENLTPTRENGLVALQVGVGRLRLLNNAWKHLRLQGGSAQDMNFSKNKPYWLLPIAFS